MSGTGNGSRAVRSPNRPECGPGHGDILDAVMEALRQARDEQCLTAREIRERLSEHLTERYAVVEHGDGQQHADPRRRPVSLSEGGICIELPPGSLQRVGHFLQLLLYLEDGGKPMRLSASRVGLEATDEATRLRLKFVNLDEVDPASAVPLHPPAAGAQSQDGRGPAWHGRPRGDGAPLTPPPPDYGRSAWPGTVPGPHA